MALHKIVHVHGDCREESYTVSGGWGGGIALEMRNIKLAPNYKISKTANKVLLFNIYSIIIMMEYRKWYVRVVVKMKDVVKNIWINQLQISCLW